MVYLKVQDHSIVRDSLVRHGIMVVESHLLLDGASALPSRPKVSLPVICMSTLMYIGAAHRRCQLVASVLGNVGAIYIQTCCCTYQAARIGSAAELSPRLSLKFPTQSTLAAFRCCWPLASRVTALLESCCDRPQEGGRTQPAESTLEKPSSPSSCTRVRLSA